MGWMAGIFVLTGAGISAESGLGVFRGEGGLWRNHRPEEVANIQAWRRDPRLVWDFYSMRRERHRAAKPNAGHFALSDLERRIGDKFFLCTQNVDSLHEQAGSQRLAHIHGKLCESKCDTCVRPAFADDASYEGDLPKCNCGGGIRPNVVWFGEALPQTELVRTFAELDRCEVFIAIGTSGVVEPVASFVRQAKSRPGVQAIFCGMEQPANAPWFDEFFIGPATEQVPKLVAAQAR
jgi:NAD-dependent deacetylase